MTTGNKTAVQQRGRHNKPKSNKYKIKDIVGIPWEVAFALRGDIYYVCKNCEITVSKQKIVYDDAAQQYYHKTCGFPV